MGRYRKVDTRIWNDARFGSLSDDAKLVFLFVLTHPHLTSLGAMRATVAGLAAELRWQSEQFSAAFDELVRADTTKERVLVEYDEQASFIGLPNFLKYNQPENPNVIKNWGTLLDLLPECKAKAQLIDRVERCIADRGAGFVSAWETISGTVCQTVSEGLPERFAKPSRKGSKDLTLNSGNGMPNQEQEQEPKQEPKQEPEPEKKDAANAAGDSSTKPKGKSQKPITIPPTLDTPAARTALEEFREHRRQKRKPLTPLAESKLLQDWGVKGAERLVAAVNHSIANGWQGLFEPDKSNNTHQGQPEMFSGIEAWLAEESDADETTLTGGIDPGSILDVQS